jgi:hypothetical protein
MKNFSIYSLALTVFILIGISSCSQTNTNTPGKTVTTLFDLIKGKEFQKITSLYVNKNGDKLNEEEIEKIEGMMTWVSSEYEKKEGIKNIVIDSEEISEDGNSAEVKYTLNFNNGETSSDKISLNKVNGDWLFLLTNK